MPNKPPNYPHQTFATLKWLVWFNIFTTILHYVDNILFFAHYPEPTWLNPTLVDAFWFVMTPFALLALWLIKHQRLYWGLVSMVLYCLMSLLVLGHYLIPREHISLKIHAFIWLEAFAAIGLLTYVMGYVQMTKPFTLKNGA